MGVPSVVLYPTRGFPRRGKTIDWMKVGDESGQTPPLRFENEKKDGDFDFGAWVSRRPCSWRAWLFWAQGRAERRGVPVHLLQEASGDCLVDCGRARPTPTIRCLMTRNSPRSKQPQRDEHKDPKFVSA